MRHLGHKGIVLIMTMISICLTFMMLYSLMQYTGVGLASSGSFYDREAALQAAQSGVDYAVTRMQTNHGWRGDSNCKYWLGTTADRASIGYGRYEDGFVVKESYGNVVGLLKNRNGNHSAFRIKFSYEDNGTNTFDKAVRSRFGTKGSSDCLPAFSIKSPYVSVNNVLNSMQVLVYRANANGVGIAEETNNLELGQGEDNGIKRAYACHLPGQRLYLIVEGLAGKGLRDCKTPEDVNKAANDNQTMTRRYVETSMTTVAPVINGDAALAKGDIYFDVVDRLFVSTNTKRANSDLSAMDDKSTLPAAGSLRTYTGGITVDNGSLQTYNGKVIFPAGKTPKFKSDKASYSFLDSEGKPFERVFDDTRTEINTDTKLTSIDWNDVAQAESSSNNRILDGFLQWHAVTEGEDKKTRYELRYYGNNYKVDAIKGYPVPIDPDKYDLVVSGSDPSVGSTVKVGDKSIKKIALGPSHKISFVTDEDFNITKPTLSVSGNIHCNGNFIIGSDQDTVKEIPHFLVSSYAPTDSNGNLLSEYEDGVITADGNIFIVSSLYGNGAIVTQTGDVTFMGDSVLESGNCGVAVYGNNVHLKSLEGAIASAPGGLSLKQDLTKVDKMPEELKKNGMTPDGDEFSEMLSGSWLRNGSLSPCDIENYLAEKFGVRVDVVSAGYRFLNDCSGRMYFDIRIAFLDERNQQIKDVSWYRLESYSDGKLNLSEQRKERHGEHGNEHHTVYDPVTSIPVPECAYIKNSDNTAKIELSEEQKAYVQEYGSICYGDQRFSGVVYAKKDFTADLGQDFNLIVDGAIRAETGSITVKCRSSKLDYNENYLSTLMPTYNKLTCRLWNCW